MALLELILGLAFIMFSLSLIASAVLEGISGWTARRGRFLQLSVMRLLAEGEVVRYGWKNAFSLKKMIQNQANKNNETKGAIAKVQSPPSPGKTSPHNEYELFFERFDNHTLFQGLKRYNGKWPSYLDKAQFADIILAVLMSYQEEGKSPSPPLDQEDLEACLQNLAQQQNPTQAVNRIYQTLHDLYLVAQGDVALFKAEVARWFEQYQARVTGWYKRRSKIKLLLMGLGIAIGLNVNAIDVFQRLNQNPEALSVIVDDLIQKHEIRYEGVDQSPTPVLIDSVTVIIREHQALFELGWLSDQVDTIEKWRDCFWWFFYDLSGWCLTAIAISMGSGFWFDLIQRLIKIRHSGIVPGEEKNEVVG